MEQLRAAFNGDAGPEPSLQKVAESCGLGSVAELARAFSGLLNIPFIEIPEEHRISRAVIRLVPEQIARRYNVVPYRQESPHAVTLLMANPLDLDAVDTVRSITKLEVHKAAGIEDQIRAAIDRSYRAEAYIEEHLQDIISLGDADEEGIFSGQSVELDQLKDQANDAPVIRFVNLLLMGAIRDRASDIHFEPAEKYISVRYRVDGVLREVTPPPAQPLRRHHHPHQDSVRPRYFRTPPPAGRPLQIQSGQADH